MEVCRDDEFIRFTAHELDEFPQASPEAPATPEQQKEFAQIVDEFDRGYERGLEAETEAAHEKLEEQWASSEPSSNA